jgi:hypothetical protein
MYEHICVYNTYINTKLYEQSYMHTNIYYISLHMHVHITYKSYLYKNI